MMFKGANNFLMRRVQAQVPTAFHFMRDQMEVITRPKVSATHCSQVLLTATHCAQVYIERFKFILKDYALLSNYHLLFLNLPEELLPF